MKFKNALWLIALTVVAIMQSCQSGRELHFFKSGDNYYRLKVTERSFASKARYMSGYYDDQAVDKYFSEMSQPKEGEAKKAEDVSFLNPAAAPGDDNSTLQIDSNKKLVMILSTNNDAVTEQIGAFAENEIMLESIAHLANKDKIEQSNAFEQNVQDRFTSNQAIIQLGDQFIAGLADTTKQDDVRNSINTFLQFLKAQNGNDIDNTGIEVLIREFQKKQQ